MAGVLNDDGSVGRNGRRSGRRSGGSRDGNRDPSGLSALLPIIAGMANGC